jgi:hypothetical protein
MTSISLSERISLFIENKGLKVAQFERLCSLANGAVSKMGENTRRSTLEKISNAFPELNINWLLTGEGEMLSSPSVVASGNTYGDNASGNNNVTISGNNSGTLQARISALQKLIEEKDKQLAQKDELLAEKDKQLAEKERLVEEKERLIKVLLSGRE